MERKITKDELEDCYGHSIHEACIILKLEMNELKVLKKDKFFLTFIFIFRNGVDTIISIGGQRKRAQKTKVYYFKPFQFQKIKKYSKKKEI